MNTIATFGEIMLRLSPPGGEKLFQSPSLSARFGGGEANVAVSLALYGHPARFISAIPANEVGEAAVMELRKFGVDTGSIVRQGKRLGIYFADGGANQRPSKVTYDRDHSAIAEAKPGDIDWDKVLDGVTWFHTTGITPAISAAAADLTLEALEKARKKGIMVSIDFNYRGKLWKYGKSAPEVMRRLVALADVGIGNEEDCQKSLGIKADADVHSGQLSVSVYEKLTADVLSEFPNLQKWRSRSGRATAPTTIPGRRCSGTGRTFWSAPATRSPTSSTGSAAETPSPRVSSTAWTLTATTRRRWPSPWRPRA